MGKIVLAYSGGLDTTVAIRWLEEKYNAKVVTVTVDVGQQEDLKKVAEKAEMIGVAKHYSIDAKKEFATDFIYPSIKANGLYEGKYPLSTALARPLIAKKLVEVAQWENAQSVAHGCTGKGNDQVRFDITLKALDPSLKILAPVREWNLSREEEIKYAREHGIPVEPKKSIFSIDQNLWGRSIEGGPLEQPDFEPPEDAFEWVKPLRRTPDEPGYIEIVFDDGVPVSYDGEEMDSVSLIKEMNKKAGEHGIGVIDHIEDRLIGIKSREVYECPAAVCLIEAHRDLEKMTLTRHQLFFKELVDKEWTWLVYAGLWIDPLRSDLDAFIASTQVRVKGKVRLKMYKGGLRVVGRSSLQSLYDLKLATYDPSSTFDQKAAEGFINLWGLPSRASYVLGKMEVKNK
jgi:argininosuccinate synthase